MNNLNFLKSIWGNRFTIIQIFIDYKIALLLIWFIIGIFIIYFIAYLNQSQRNIFSIIRSPFFYLPVAFLMLLIIVFILSLRKEVTPPNDGKIYITITKFDNTIEGRALQNSIEAELEKWLPLAGNLVLKKKAILETVKNKDQAKKFGKRRGLHFILYGNIYTGRSESKKSTIESELLQIWPFKKNPTLGKFTLSSPFDPNNLRDVKRVARDFVVKIIKTYESNQFLSVSGRINIRNANIGTAPGATIFNIGSNLLIGLDFVEKVPNDAYLKMRTKKNGKFSISGRFFDSDGNNSIEIINNEIVQSKSTEAFRIIRIGDLFIIYDSYERTIFQLTEEEDIERFLDALVVYRKSTMGPELPQDYKSSVRGLQRLLTVRGELYRSDGMPIGLIEQYQLIAFSDAVQIPLGLGSQVKTEIKPYKPGTYVFRLEAGQSTDHWLRQPNKSNCAFESNNGQFEVRYSNGKIVRAWAGDKFPGDDPIFKIYAVKDTYVKIIITEK